MSKDDQVLDRYSFTLPSSLIDRIDTTRSSMKKKMNRSQIVREALDHWQLHRSQESELIGEGICTISYLFDHHMTRVVQELTSAQHSYESVIINNIHYHLSHNQCLEIITCKGGFSEIIKLENELRAVKGIGKLLANYFDI